LNLPRFPFPDKSAGAASSPVVIGREDPYDYPRLHPPFTGWDVILHLFPWSPSLSAPFPRFFSPPQVLGVSSGPPGQQSDLEYISVSTMVSFLFSFFSVFPSFFLFFSETFFNAPDVAVWAGIQFLFYPPLSSPFVGFLEICWSFFSRESQ